MIRRINLTGGPGAGKTTTAARLFADLSVLNYPIYPVHEFVKQWAIEKRPIVGFDQNYIHGSQMHLEEQILRRMPLIITDAPLPVICYYSVVLGCPTANQLIESTHIFEREYPSFNVFLDREGIPYETEGRYQNAEEAVLVDAGMQEMLGRFTSYEKIRTLDYDQILAATREAIDEGRDS